VTEAGPALDRHSFGRGKPLSVGLEEEVLLVDGDTLQLAHVADELLPRIRLPEGRADHEAFLAQLELRADPSASATEAVAQLAEGRRAAAAAGATLLAVGLHPDAAYGDVELVRSERYERVEHQMRGLIRRTPESALHVHVGIPDPDTAVRVLMGVREALPLLHGLSASSPFWFGIDSGLASARAAVIRAYPGRGVPPPLQSWDHYLETLEAIRAGGGPSDHTMVWWDARLQPRLGTVELREVDVQPSLDAAAGIAALTRALALRSAESSARALAPEQALHWSSFRAARDGLDAKILHRGSLTPLREAARSTLDEVGLEDPALEGIERILAEGGGAARQRAAHARGGMPGLLRFIADETARGAGGYG
jgi:glutamate---cysteine ligase / carboxylate-amine ligase